MVFERAVVGGNGEPGHTGVVFAGARQVHGQQRGGEGSAGGFVHMGQCGQGPFGVQRGGQVNGVTQPGLGVDHGQPARGQLAALLQFFDQAGAHKAQIGLALQHGIDHFVLGPPGFFPVPVAGAHTRLRQFDHGGQVAQHALVVQRWQGNGQFAAVQQAEIAQVGAGRLAQHHGPPRGHSAARFMDALRHQCARQGVAVPKRHVLHPVGQHKVELGGLHGAVQFVPGQRGQSHALVGQCFLQVLHHAGVSLRGGLCVAQGQHAQHHLGFLGGCVCLQASPPHAQTTPPPQCNRQVKVEARRA